MPTHPMCMLTLAFGQRIHSHAARVCWTRPHVACVRCKLHEQCCKWQRALFTMRAGTTELRAHEDPSKLDHNEAVSTLVGKYGFTSLEQRRVLTKQLQGATVSRPRAVMCALNIDTTNCIYLDGCGLDTGAVTEETAPCSRLPCQSRGPLHDHVEARRHSSQGP